MISISINGATSRDAAEKFAHEFVLIKRKDLKKIERLVKKKKFYEELKALNIDVQEIVMHNDDCICEDI